MTSTWDLWLCPACAALYREAVGRCGVCGRRVVPTTEELVRDTGRTPAEMVEATQRYIEEQGRNRAAGIPC